MKKETQLCFLIDFLFILAIFILVCSFIYLLPLFYPFIAAFLLAMIYKSLSDTIKTRINIKSKWSMLFSALLFYLFISAALWLLITTALGDVLNIAHSLPDLFQDTVLPSIDRLKDSIKDFLPSYDNLKNNYGINISNVLLNSVNEVITKLSQKLVDFAGSFFKNIPVFLISFIFTILSSFYIAMDYDSIKAFFKRAIPEDFHFFFIAVREFCSKCLGKILKSYFILMLITFAELLAGFLLLKVSHPVKSAVFIAILDILPLLGTGTVLIPWAVFSLLTNELSFGTGIFVLWAFITVIRNILEPHLIAKELGLSPLLTLLSCFLGLKTMGLKGMIVSPVIFLALKYMFKEDKEITK